MVLYISINALFTKPVSPSNTTLVKGTYNSIQREVYRGSVSYNLYLNENSEYYKINASNAECFAYTSFTNRVSSGQPISIYVNNNTLLSQSFVVSVIANGQEYLSFDCINHQIADDKIKIPLMSIGVLLVLVMIAYLKSKKKSVKSLFN